MNYKQTRQGYVDGLLELAEEMPHLVVLDADVAKATKTVDFQQAHPDRFFNCGVQEQNMLSVAAGLALEGFLPFASTFGVKMPPDLDVRQQLLFQGEGAAGAEGDFL